MSHESNSNGADASMLAGNGDPRHSSQMRLNFIDNETCSKLVELALKEDWELLDYRKGQKYWILKRYLLETFERLVYEDGEAKSSRRKIIMDKKQTVAVFNTGIPDPHYQDIYALLNTCSRDDGLLLNIVGFFLWPDSKYPPETNGKAHYEAAIRAFGNHPPARASYYQTGQDVFNPARTLNCAFGHIIYERLHRLPFSYLTRAVNGIDTRTTLLEVLERARELEAAGKVNERDHIMTMEARPILEQGENALYKKIYYDLRKAAEVARRRASYSPGFAVAGYYPKEHCVSFYLPLCLEYEEQPDLVLVANLDKNKKSYTGRTIISLDDAYADARLIAKPIENWIEAASGDIRQANNERSLSPRTAIAPSIVNLSAKASLIHDGSYDLVRPGYVIGVRRGSDDRYNPDIALGSELSYISNRHGEFDCRDGSWSFISYGQNGTKVRRGADDFTLEKGLPFTLQADDELIMGGHRGFVFVPME
ncbi:MAG: DUF3825 domain-containing protein [Eggerthellaceae bacterium]|nr:DUF3825 domain-containing protein [Eggerthellaceae bacterium]